MSKYKYYFKKPKSEIIKDILRWIATAGIVYVAASSPYFILNVMKEFKKRRRYKTHWRKKQLVDDYIDPETAMLQLRRAFGRKKDKS